jgi:glutathione S-transferase
MLAADPTGEDHAMLTAHHLRRSQSERIVWLCEELAIPYTLVLYDRQPDGLAPPDYKALQAFGTAPIVTDGELALGESGAIVDYVTAKHGGGRLAVGPEAANFADYLYWFHFANGSMMPARMVAMIAGRLGLSEENPAARALLRRSKLAYAVIEDRLGRADYFAGPELTAADIMMVYTLTTTRVYTPYDLAPYPNVRAYLQRIGARRAYQRAMAKAEPGFAPLLE